MGPVIVVAGTNTAAWARGATSAHNPLPLWPAFMFGLIAVVGLYAVIASLLHIWPFHMLRSANEVIDDCIRAGRDTRERIVREELSDLDAQAEYVRWFMRTSEAIARYVPAVADDFLVAQADEQALVVRLIKEKIDVLARARREM